MCTLKKIRAPAYTRDKQILKVGKKKFFMFLSIHDYEVGTYAEIASLL